MLCSAELQSCRADSHCGHGAPRGVAPKTAQQRSQAPACEVKAKLEAGWAVALSEGLPATVLENGVGA